MSRGVPSLRVLLVEDSAGVVDLVTTLLDGEARLALRHVPSVAAAVEALAKTPADVLLLDLDFADALAIDRARNGKIDTIRRMRNVAPTVPIVVLSDTEREDEDLAFACLEAGAQDFVLKNELTRVRIRRVLGHALSRSRQEQIALLERTLEEYASLSSSGAATSVSRGMAGVGPVRDRVPDEYQRAVVAYAKLLDLYMEQMLHKTPRPRAEMEILATALGDLGGGPRDVIDVHVAAMGAAVSGTPPARANALALEGRLFALEMMGLLVDYYRVGVRRYVDHEGVGS